VYVSGGSMYVTEVIAELQWIVLDEQYQWEVKKIEDGVFRVNFPSKLDLVCVQHFGR
jgi:hypothetical protein